MKTIKAVIAVALFFALLAICVAAAHGKTTQNTVPLSRQPINPTGFNLVSHDAHGYHGFAPAAVKRLKRRKNVR
jgi:hypothetical protein